MEKNSNVISFASLLNKNTQKAKLPYFRRMIRIWLKNGVKNKYTSAYRLRKIDMRFREGPLDDSEFLARRQQIAKQLLSYKVPVTRQKR